MKETRYQIIEWDERYWIVDEGTFATEKKVTPNLIEGEVKIIRLSVKDCPLKENCIELEGKPGEEITSICKYLGKYHHIRATVPCLYDGYLERDLFKLLPDPVSIKAKYGKTQFSPVGRATICSTSCLSDEIRLTLTILDLNASFSPSIKAFSSLWREMRCLIIAEIFASSFMVCHGICYFGPLKCADFCTHVLSFSFILLSS